MDTEHEHQGPMLRVGSVPDGRNPHRCLFNTERFVGLRDRIPEYQALVTSDGVALGDLAHVDGVSGWMAPYGGPDWRRDYWAPELIHDAVARHDFGDLHTIRCKPLDFGENEPALLNALLSVGWRIDEVALNYASPIMEVPSRFGRQVRHAIEQTVELDPEIGFACDCHDAESYDLLAANRAAKGRRLSFEYEYMVRLRETFGDLIRVIDLYIAERLVASALLYRVAKGRDMVQFHGDLPGHGLGFSPMPYLVFSYCAIAAQDGAQMIDMGISTNDGVVDSGLVRFKRSVGMLPSNRFVLKR